MGSPCVRTRLREQWQLHDVAAYVFYNWRLLLAKQARAAARREWSLLCGLWPCSCGALRRRSAPVLTVSAAQRRPAAGLLLGDGRSSRNFNELRMRRVSHVVNAAAVEMRPRFEDKGIGALRLRT